MGIPDAPCMDYLRTLGEKWPHSKGNVGKYSLHGAFGYTFTLEVQVDYFLNVFSVKTIVLVGIYNQQFKGTIFFMVFDFQGLCPGQEVSNQCLGSMGYFTYTYKWGVLGL